MAHKVGVYCRISQDRMGASLGIERQVTDCRDLAARLGWDVLGVYADNDMSAYSGKPRKHYERLLGDVESGHVDAVICWHADRLHRSPVELERYISVCDPLGVPTYTVKAGELDLSTATGRMTARIVGAVARGESELKGERVARQKQQAQADGKWLGGRRPFGFAPDGVTLRPTVEQLRSMYERAAAKYGHPLPTTDELAHLADRIGDELDALADATRRVLAGDSVRSIVTEWNGAGLTTTTGARWTGSNLRQMLMRPRNAGLVGNGSRVVGKAQWNEIVERDTWEALVALLSDSSRLTHSGTTSRKLVGSFLNRCECGERVRSGGNGANGQPRYACTTQHLRRAAAPIDDYVTKVVTGVLIRDNVRLIAEPDNENNAGLRDRRAVLRVRSAQIAAMFGDPDSVMTNEQFKIANERLQRELRDINAKLGRPVASPLVGIADADDPEVAFRAADVDRQRAVIDVLMTVVLLRSATRGRRAGGGYFDPTTVEIVPKRPLMLDTSEQGAIPVSVG
jgi:site-specific DNA recombinase